MKRILCLIISLMVLLSLIACAQTPVSEENESNEKPTATSEISAENETDIIAEAEKLIEEEAYAEASKLLIKDDSEEALELLKQCAFQAAMKADATKPGKQAIEEGIALLNGVGADNKKLELEAKLEVRYMFAEDLERQGNKIMAAVIFGQCAVGYDGIDVESDAYARSFELWTDFVYRKTFDSHGQFAVAIKEDGSILSTSTGDDALSGKATAVSFGMFEHLLLKADGTVYAFNDEVKFSDEWTNIVAINTGNGSYYGLRADGVVLSVAPSSGLTDSVELNSLEGVKKLAIGKDIITIENTTADTQNTEYVWRTTHGEEFAEVYSGRFDSMGITESGKVLVNGAAIDPYFEEKVKYIDCDAEGIAAVTVDGSVILKMEDFMLPPVLK